MVTAIMPVRSWPVGTGTVQLLAGSQSAAAPSEVQGTGLCAFGWVWRERDDQAVGLCFLFQERMERDSEG